MDPAPDQASGNEVAALISMPLMKRAATNVENVRKASPVMVFLLFVPRPIA